MDRASRDLKRKVKANPTKIHGIDHVVLRTEHMATMLSFYQQVLGCEVERELSPEVGLVQLRAGFSLIDLVEVDSELGRMGGPAPAESGHNLDHFCLEIDALDEALLLDWLASQKVSASEFAKRYGANGFGRSIYIQDPDGNTVELKLANSKS